MKRTTFSGEAAIVIRPYRDQDEAAVVALWQQCGLTVAWNNPHKDIERKINVDRQLLLVGVVDTRLVATVMGGYEGHRGWINYLAVAPDCRQLGYGRSMMSRIEKMLGERGCPKINLQIRSGNAVVVAFYEAIGYSVDPVISLGKRLVSDP